MPNGSPIESDGNGFAWFDVSDTDIKDSNPPLHATRIGVRSIGAEFGLRHFNGASAKPIFFNISPGGGSGNDKIVHWMNADGSQRSPFYGSGDFEAVDLSKTPSDYTARFATDGTILEEEDKTVKSNTVGEPTGSDVVLNVVSLTQAEYDAGTKIATTLYIIIP